MMYNMLPLGACYARKNYEFGGYALSMEVVHFASEILNIEQSPNCPNTRI